MDDEDRVLRAMGLTAPRVAILEDIETAVFEYWEEGIDEFEQIQMARCPEKLKPMVRQHIDEVYHQIEAAIEPCMAEFKAKALASSLALPNVVREHLKSIPPDAARSAAAAAAAAAAASAGVPASKLVEDAELAALEAEVAELRTRLAAGKAKLPSLHLSHQQHLSELQGSQQLNPIIKRLAEPISKDALEASERLQAEMQSAAQLVSQPQGRAAPPAGEADASMWDAGLSGLTSIQDRIRRHG